MDSADTTMPMQEEEVQDIAGGTGDNAETDDEMGAFVAENDPNLVYIDDDDDQEGVISESSSEEEDNAEPVSADEPSSEPAENPQMQIEEAARPGV